MKHLSIDIETRSSVDLRACGLYKYAAAPDFRVLLFGYAWEGEPARVIDLANGAHMPNSLLDALADPGVAKHAFNAAFERVCLSRALGLPEGRFLDPSQWRCTMVQAAYWGAGGSLRQVGDFLGVEMRKDAAGTRLINKFSKAVPGKAPAFEGEDWERFVSYCARDVDCEAEIASRLPGPVPEGEQRLYVLDQRVNDRGVLVDGVLATQAVRMSETAAEAAREGLERVTGLENPNSPSQLLAWLRSRGCEVAGCGREVLAAEAQRDGCDPLARRAIGLRLASAKSSVKKYKVAAEAPGADGRLRGCFQFYGAATGRWAGRLMQLQNLPRGDLHGPEIDIARELVRAGDAEAVQMVFGGVPDVLKSLVRTVLVPRDGCAFAVSDFSAIEARVLAWLAGEAWTLEVFRTTGKVYEATASRMFGIPVEKVDRELRQRGKVATLALGYQGGPKALERMGALAMGIPAGELPKLVRMWRNANRRIKAFWAEMEGAARSALLGEGSSKVAGGRVMVRRASSIGGLSIRLPSGRSLHYRRAAVDPIDGHLSYMACGKGAGALKVETYGGRLVENVTQAVARDVLAEAMVRLERAGCEVVAHVHDEVIAEVPRRGAEAGLAGINELMGETPTWAQGLPLKAEGYVCESYRKE